MRTCLLLFAALPGLLCAQMPRGMWWEGRPVQDVLNEAQAKQIRGIQHDFRTRMFNAREAVNKAEREVEGVFNEDPVDQKKANEAIERLATVRAEMFRTTSEMELKIRSVLTAEQWQTLKQRANMRGPGGRGGPWHRGGPGKGGPPPANGTITTPPPSKP